MAPTGAVAPRVVVRPPNVPAPPPISLLTQNNLVEDDRDVFGVEADGPGRWEGGGGSIWLDPQHQFDDNQVWQTWPGDSGTATTNKLGRSSGGAATASSIAAADQAPVQLPIFAALELDQGVLSEFALRNSIEGPVETQMTAALGAVLPRLIERELWTSAEAVHALWTQQFRLKTPNVVTTTGTGALPYLRALAAAEQAAFDQRFIDQFGGAFIHVSPFLFSLIAASHPNLIRSPSGRQITLPSGAVLIPEGGASGAWSEGATTSVLDARPGGSPAGDNAATGWLFVTPPVRVRLGQANVYRADAHTGMGSAADSNNRRWVAERPFVLEASVASGRNTSVGVPVDYTTSGA